MRTLLPIFVMLALHGCAAHQMYDGKARSPDEIVKITGMSGINPLNDYRGTMVCAVDGITLDPCKTDIELLPGEHTLLLRSTNVGIESGKNTITKIFSPGSKYVIGLKFENVVDAIPILMKSK